MPSTAPGIRALFEHIGRSFPRKAGSRRARDSSGCHQARRAGCLAARGRLIANIDADTLLPRGWLDTVVEEFAHSPGLVALSGPFIHYDASRTVRIVVAVFYRLAFTTYLMVRLVFRAGSMMQGGNPSNIASTICGSSCSSVRFRRPGSTSATRST